MVVPLTHPRAGRIRLPGVPVKLAEAPGSVRTPPPLLGGDTDAVLSELLDMKADEIERLRKVGAIA